MSMLRRQTMKRLALPLTLLACLAAGPLMAGPVFGAACSSPAGNEADRIYNGDYHTWQFCNGTSWRAFAGALYQQVSGGSGYCANPAGKEADQIYNGTYHTWQFCNGTNWEPFGAYSAPPAPTGYFVLSKSTWNGNLGGRSGADALCLTELTTNTGWMGYSTANSEGLLVSGNVHAFLVCDETEGECNTLLPSTTYTFANANNSSAGGATFTTDDMGYGPGNSNNWSSSTYFGTTTADYWTGNNVSTSTQWRYTAEGSGTCSSWSSSSSSVNGEFGNSNTTGGDRWGGQSAACNTSENLVCYVNP
jgi:Protein of unknown function (DUF1554)